MWIDVISEHFKLNLNHKLQMQEVYRVAEQKMTEALEPITRQRREMKAEENRILKHIHRDQKLLKQHMSIKESSKFLRSSNLSKKRALSDWAAKIVRDTYKLFGQPIETEQKQMPSGFLIGGART